MTVCLRSCVRKLGLVAAIAACLSLFASGAQAAPVEGCDPKILSAQQAVAQARVAESKAIDDEIFVQDDSVLALTCFNKAASHAAHAAGNVFSGDFRQELNTVVKDGLAGVYSNFKDYTAGGPTDIVDYDEDDGDGNDALSIDTTTAMTDPMPFECNNLSNLWNFVNNQGVTATAPYSTLDEAIDDAPITGSGGKYQLTRGSGASLSIRATARASLDLNGDGTLGNEAPVIPTYSTTQTVCDVLLTGARATVTVCP